MTPEEAQLASDRGFPLPIVVTQGDLAAWNRCPAEFNYHRQERRSDQNSASAYGSVIHHALHALERYRDLDRAVETFLYYWHPLNIDQITEPVPQDGWIGRQSYSELRARGVDAIRKYADLLKYDDHELLGLEYEFVVPLQGTPFWVTGVIDRLAVRYYNRKPAVCIDDWKTGRQKWGLRNNVQGTLYAYATTQVEFWTGVDGFAGERLGKGVRTYDFPGFGHDRGMELYERFAESGRRFTWINMQSYRRVDGGYRGPVDYERLRLAVTEIVRSCQHEIFPLRIDGETCTYCLFRKTCGGVGVPDEEHGSPHERRPAPATS